MTTKLLIPVTSKIQACQNIQSTLNYLPILSSVDLLFILQRTQSNRKSKYSGILTLVLRLQLHSIHTIHLVKFTSSDSKRIINDYSNAKHSIPMTKTMTSQLIAKSQKCNISHKSLNILLKLRRNILQSICI